MALPVQAVPSPDSWWMQLLEMLGAGVLGATAIWVGNRVRFRDLERDIKDLREDLKEDVGRIEKAIQDRQNSDVAADLRDDAKTREALSAIRRDNDANHNANLDRLRVMRQQLFAIVQLMAKIARATPGINQDDVDLMMVRVHSAEVERAD